MRNWTVGQQSAINVRGGDTLVSAAAGSGKTAVLIERVIKLITNHENPVDINNILIVTFSRAAAEEVRLRLAKRMSEILESDPGNLLIKRAGLKLDSANISTIHAFCSRIIRENNAVLDWDSKFRIADEMELFELRSKAMNTLIDNYYNENDDVFLELCENLGKVNSDKTLEEMIQKIYDFSRSYPFENDFEELTLSEYRNFSGIKNSIWGTEVFGFLDENIQHMNNLINSSIEIICDDENIKSKYYDNFLNIKLSLEKLEKLSENRDYNEICSLLSTDIFGKLPQLRGYKDSPEKNYLQNSRKFVKKCWNDLHDDFFFCTEEEFESDVKKIRPFVEKLFELKEAFSRIFTGLKREKGCVDFSDLEHLTLQLLLKKNDDGSITETNLPAKLRAEFDEILIDEYQDTNKAQDMIFETISNKNRFMVGDVKQSIYGFRLADPTLFQKYKNEFYPYESKKFPCTINLNNNFRSRMDVTGGINYIFGRIMSPKIGGISYDKNEALNPMANYLPGKNTGMSIEIIEQNDDDSDEPLVEKEAAKIAELIKKMMEEKHQICENGIMRNVKFSDFCILLRSAKNKSKIYKKALENLQIDVIAPTEDPFFSQKEISTILSLLRILDNHTKDVDMLSVMMSDIFAFTADEIAMIRIKSGFKNSLYQNVVRQSKSGDEHCANFMNTLNRLRQYASVLKVSKLIQKIFDITNYDCIIAAKDGSGNEKISNLHTLLEHADSYEIAGYRGLSGFIRFVDSLCENGRDFASGQPNIDSIDSVKIMTIHKSKGLEFPIVILADTSKRINEMDLRAKSLSHERLGFSCEFVDPKYKFRKDSLIHSAVKLAIQRDILSEEMRILYVALTRAKEKLIIAMTCNEIAKTTQKIASLIGRNNGIPAFVLRSQKSYSEWILSAVLDHPDAVNLRTFASMIEPKSCEKNCSPIEINISSESIRQVKKHDQHSEKVIEFSAKSDPEILNSIRKKIARNYPFYYSTLLPHKVTVSELTHSDSDFESQKVSLKIPKFRIKNQDIAAQKGTALHKFLQFADYDLAKKDCLSEIKRMTNLGFISEADANLIEEQRLILFFKSELFSKIESAKKILREVRFLDEISACQYDSGLPKKYSSEKIVLQGIADCVLLNGTEMTIIDYKTDRISNESELKKRYSKQISLYADSFQKRFGCEKCDAFIYSFWLGRSIEIM